MTRTLIVGSGFVGRAVAARLTDSGENAVLASRRPPEAATAPWIPLDAADAASCARAVDRVRPDRLVLVHGPSDVTWCEAHPERAAALHTAATAHLTAAAPGCRTVLISTDNVFDGSSPENDESTPTAPANAYGRAKLRAERIVRETADGTVLRVSLVYGWEPPHTTKWLNYFSACAHRLRRGEPVEAPDDQWTTPVLAADVAAVTAAVLAAGAPSLLHLGGPDRISRAAWAEAVADGLGVPRSLVVRVPKALGRYASRPVNTCLTSDRLEDFLAARGLRVRGVAEGVRTLLEDAP
ncbi:sugar nucleotide-binding protein [Streptomyces sp. SP18CS02]|uniref:sugar nucleotide-binding protein n=1 Tax=Streptomyces sp. SP18CS02 TaxID=3002531 RepID=UPI002E775462|nr:sugar nucleotide-binding protein [Streptomyces sp. SP18CS02]MEE1752152.1 sugar nucleotide-binding protein [Streptomyces sp. SP18CS02]